MEKGYSEYLLGRFSVEQEKYNNTDFQEKR